ncbi:MAG: hypothetical protein V2B20_02900 [Pseudomonadota bacterium]
MGTCKYNLEQLGWFNFEQLARTLLRQIIGNGVSTFSGSVDKGRDATFSGEATSFPSESDRWSGEWIFQVKHRTYSTRGADKVRAELKRILPTEIERILSKHHHVCQHYVVITNCPLTAQDKDELHGLIRLGHDEILQVSVLGESDLQELLDCHPRIVSAFPQILGVSQLRELIEWGLHRRSLDYLLAAQAEIATFVATSPYLNAIELLHKQHFCVLTGPPKMGKTCTAYALAASFSALSYEVFDLRNQRDFYDAYRDDAKQLFICDDVFGDISLLASQRDDWTRGFLRLVGSLGRDHKLVWTAREYILKEAIASSRLKEERPAFSTTDTVTVAVDHLSRFEKATILYNHARMANLPTEVRDYLRGKACIMITDHPNYSPESIRQLCTGRLVTFSESVEGNAKEIEAKVSSFLKAPGDAWKTAYFAASPGERLLCTEVMAAGGTIRMSDLRRRYEDAILGAPEVFHSFDISLASAHGTFLRRKPLLTSDAIVQFYHPSMRDLLVELIQSDKATRIAYLRQLALKELSAITGPTRSTRVGGSEKHRIAVTDSSDIELLRDHIRETLLPAAGLSDTLSVITDLHLALVQSKSTSLGRKVRDLSQFGSVFWMILDSVVPYACSKQFWQHNSDAASVIHWRRLFEVLRSLLPYASTPSTPEYVPELLRRRKVDNSVDYWGLVAAAHTIVPTVVEQSVEMQERDVCRKQLAQTIVDAISEAETLDLENDCSDSQYWHDEYSTIPDDCDDYAELFPDDEEIPGVNDLSQIIEDYPRLDEQSDEDQNYSSLRSSSSSSDADIQQLFSDL